MLTTFLGAALSVGDSTGGRLQLSASSNNYFLLNDTSPTFLILPNQNLSSIDLSFVSAPLLPLSTWSVSPDFHSSDHFPTFIFIDCGRTARTFFSSRIRKSSIDWFSFHTNASDCLNNFNPSLLSDSFFSSATSSCYTFDFLTPLQKYTYLANAIISFIVLSQPSPVSSRPVSHKR